MTEFTRLLIHGFFVVIFLSSQCLGSNRLPVSLKKPVGDPSSAIQGLVSRVLGPNYVSKFQFEVIPDEGGHDVFEVDGSVDGQRPVLRGNNGVALASALNFYLKYMCNCSISWGRERTGDQLNLPGKLPVPSNKFRVASPVLYRYYQNVCTVSYSMAWWDFKRWEREIDWMAMNGLNLILSFTGQEYIWHKLYINLGLDDIEMDAYFSGPAFLAWQRMGNIRAWGGPIDHDWVNRQADLQRQILNRTRSFGMINVLPGFAGHIPTGLTFRHINASYAHSTEWNSFAPQYTNDWLVEPTDPLFKTVGTQYYKLLIQEFGTDHVYNCDTYNEMDPSSSDLNFLAETNKVIFDTMAAADQEAVFIMQGWLFHYSNFWSDLIRVEAFLSGVPNDKMIILDLCSEQTPVWNKTHSYFGKSFIWCLLHNYGGNRGVYGPLDVVATDPVDALRNTTSTMIGTGLAMEAIEHNPVIYDLMGEMGWSTDHVDVDRWLKFYSSRRYGSYSPNAENAWALLKTSVYQHQWSGTLKSAIVRSPGFNVPVDMSFNLSGLVDAWKLLYQAASSGEVNYTVGPFQYDLVDVGRQCLVDLFYDVYRMFVSAYNHYTPSSASSLGLRDANSVAEDLEVLSAEMLEIILEVDAYLGTNVNFLFGTWIADARLAAGSDTLADNFEFNARNQISMWGPEANINDYAAKEWSGLLQEYYYERWALLTNMTVASVKSSRLFNSTEYNEKLFNIEKQFSYKTKSYPTQPSGDVVQMTKHLIEKYVPMGLVESDYFVVKHISIPGNDIMPGSKQTWTQNANQIAYLCNINPSCVGFTSDGKLKTSTSGQHFSFGNVFYAKRGNEIRNL